MNRLIVKNFGPLKSIDIELNKINLFIGENGSGKSVLRKLITILYNVFNNINSTKEDMIKYFEDYKINYLSKDSVIEFTGISNNKRHDIIKIKDLEFEFGNIINELKDGFSIIKDTKKIIEKEKNNQINIIKEKINMITKLKALDGDKQNLQKIEDDLKKLLNTIQNENKSLQEEANNLIGTFNKLNSRYIPSERNFISIISQSLSSFIVSEIPLPRFFLQFASDFENAANQIQEINFLNVKYIYGDGLDRHKVYFDDKNYLPLNESSSGIQAVIPLLITYKYFTQKYHTIIIEEPEQNLFPKAQKEVVEFIIENLKKDNWLFLMTHSPYILTALNNLILANDVKEAKGEEAIKGLVKVSQCIPFENINAYYIKDGKAVNIMDKENRLIGVNVIDEISDEVNETFDILLSKLD